MQKLSRCFFTTLLTLAICSCEHFLTNGSGDQDLVTITLTSTSSKTMLQGDSEVLWQNNDMLMINGRMYPIILDSLDTSSAYVRNVPEAEEYYAAYLYGNIYEDGDIISGGYLWYSQEYIENGFGQYMNPMVGYSTDTSIIMHNMGSILKVGVIGEYDIRHLSVSGICLGGYLKLSTGTIKDEQYDAYITNGAEDSIELDFRGKTVSTQGLKYFYFVVAPGEQREGILITMEDKDGNIYIKNTFNSIDLIRSQIKEMEEFEFNKVKDISISVNEISHDNVQYTIQAEPGAIALSQIIRKDTYDRIKDTDYIIDSLFTNISDAFCYHRADIKGEYRRVHETEANTEYVIMARYGDGRKGMGEIFTAEFSTPEAPQIPETPKDEDHIQVSFNQSFESPSISVLLSQEVTAFRYTYMKGRVYDYKSHNCGLSDSDILTERSKKFTSEDILEAQSSYLTKSLTNISYSHDDHYCFIFEATLQSGETVIRHDWSHFSEPETNHNNWDIISDNAVIRGSNQDYSEEFECHGLTVLKAQGKEIYLIEDCMPLMDQMFFFLEQTTPLNASFIGNQRLLIDATDTNSVKIIAPYTYLPFHKYYEDDKSLCLYIANSSIGAKYTKDTFDGNIFTFNTLRIMEEDVMGLFLISYRIRNVTLDLNIHRLETSGIKLESYVKEDMKTPW